MKNIGHHNINYYLDKEYNKGKNFYDLNKAGSVKVVYLSCFELSQDKWQLGEAFRSEGEGSSGCKRGVSPHFPGPILSLPPPRFYSP